MPSSSSLPRRAPRARGARSEGHTQRGAHTLAMQRTAAHLQRTLHTQHSRVSLATNASHRLQVFANAGVGSAVVASILVAACNIGGTACAGQLLDRHAHHPHHSSPPSPLLPRSPLLPLLPLSPVLRPLPLLPLLSPLPLLSFLTLPSTLRTSPDSRQHSCCVPATCDHYHRSTATCLTPATPLVSLVPRLPPTPLASETSLLPRSLRRHSCPDPCCTGWGASLSSWAPSWAWAAPCSSWPPPSPSPSSHLSRPSARWWARCATDPPTHPLRRTLAPALTLPSGH